MSIELYPHNQKTYDNIISIWEKENRAATIQPTGSGKSFLILKCAETYNDSNKIILAPSNYILEQMGKHSVDIKNIKYITYAKLQNMTDEEIKTLDLKLIVLDEFHRCGAEEWGNGVQRLLNTYQEAKILGTSATPIRYLDNARDMSDEIFNGNIACNITLPQAIVEGILPMPKYVSALYTFEEEANNMINKVNNSKNTEDEKKMLIKDIEKLKNKLNKSKGIPKILQKYIVNTSGKYIVFCKNKEHMDEMKITVIKWFEAFFKFENINSNIVPYEVYSRSGESDNQLNNFIDNNSGNALRLLFSIDMLNEGIHINDLDGVILLRPTTSPIIYYQQIGRAIDAGRKDNPLILDFVNNFDNIKVNNFKNDLITTAYEYLKNNNKEYGNNDEFISKFLVFDETYDAINLFNNIENNLIDNFDMMLNELIKYKEIYGNCNVSDSGEYKKLGRWVSYQRQCKINKRLSKDRETELDNIGFIWEEKNEIRWQYMFDLLNEYLTASETYIIKENMKYKNELLGAWVKRQRSLYETGVLEKDKIAQFNSIGFILDINESEWGIGYNELEQYYNTYKTYLMDKNYHTISGYNLYSWTRKQRLNYSNNKLNKMKIDKLNSIGFIWDIQNDWDTMYETIKDYLSYNENKNLHPNLVYKDLKIGKWINQQIYKYKNNMLELSKYNKLNDLGLEF